MFRIAASPMKSGQSWKVSKPDVTFDFLEGEVIAIHLPSGFYFSLRDTAAFVWQALEAGWDTARINGRLAQCPDTSPAGIATDLEVFLAELAGNQLIVATGQPEPKTDVLVPDPAAYTRPVLEKYADLQDLLLLDPIHEVTDQGWPHAKP